MIQFGQWISASGGYQTKDEFHGDVAEISTNCFGNAGKLALVHKIAEVTDR